MPRTTGRPLVFVLLLAALWLAGCSDDSTEPSINESITLNLPVDPFGVGADGGLAWVSAPDGATLAVATWSSDTTLVFDLGESGLDEVSYTLAMDPPGGELVLSTETDVPVGTDRTYTAGPGPQLERDATIGMAHAPECTSSLVAWQGASITTVNGLHSQYFVPFYTDSVDIFVRANPTEGTPLGAWLMGVKDREARTVDFEHPFQTSAMIPFEVTVPDGGASLVAQFGVIHDSGSQRGFIAMDRQEFNDGVPAAFTMHGTAWDPEELAFVMFLHTDSDPPLIYGHSGSGREPTSFVRLPGELTVPAQQPAAGATFAMTGTWSMTAAAWRHEDDSQWYWIASSSSDRAAFTLPDLPAEFAALFPDCTRDGFRLSRVELGSYEAADRLLTVAWSDAAAGKAPTTEPVRVRPPWWPSIP